MTNYAEEMRGRRKTKTNTKVRRRSGVAKIDGVDDDENKEQEDEKHTTYRRSSEIEKWYASTILASQVNGKGRNTR